MSAVHDRWELVEPLLVATPLRDPSAFAKSQMEASEDELLRSLRHDHVVEEDCIARALAVRDHALDADAPHQSRKPRRIREILVQTAGRWLECDGHRWTLRVEAGLPGYEILRWRAASVLIPPSVFVGAALASTRAQQPRRLEVLPESLAPKNRVAHGHVHLGPLLQFEHLWGGLWRAFFTRGSLDESEKSISAAEPPELGNSSPIEQLPGLRWQWMLELAFLARAWLEHAVDKDDLRPPDILMGFARGRVHVGERHAGLLRMWWREQPIRNRSRAVLEERRSHFRRADEAPSPDFPDDEVRLLARCLDPSRSAPWIERIVYQYLRVKVALYRHLVVDPWTTGLKHFLDVEERDRPYAHLIRKVDGRDALRWARLGPAEVAPPLHVRALEVHTLPEKWVKEERPTRRPLDRERGLHWRTNVEKDDESPVASSWLLSFSRTPKARIFEEAPGRAWCIRAAEVDAVCRRIGVRIEAQPSTLIAARGLGLMAWERNGPMWLFAGPFGRLLRTSRQVASRYAHLGLEPLRTSFHLGEDFVHLLSGLRRIYEPFEWDLISRGDRVGHALALGLDVDEWRRRNGWVRMRPWDRLLDIGFAYWAFDRWDLSFESSDVLTRYRLQAGHCLRMITGSDPRAADPLAMARDIWRALPHAQPEMERWSAMRSCQDDESGLGMIQRVLHNASMGRRAMEASFSVDTTLDVPVMKALHKLVADRVASWQVAIEVNPSSNLLVGGFRSIFEQPFFHGSDLPITISSDDILTFATTLADDYAYAWAGMVVGGENEKNRIAPADATRWLEEAARCSMRYSFATGARKRPG